MVRRGDNREDVRWWGRAIMGLTTWLPVWLLARWVASVMSSLPTSNKLRPSLHTTICGICTLCNNMGYDIISSQIYH